MASNLSFVLLLLLVAQGWTVTVYATRERVGLLVSMGAYALISLISFIIAASTPEPASTQIAFQVRPSSCGGSRPWAGRPANAARLVAPGPLSRPARSSRWRARCS